ncbi:peptidylprolyl isomerase [Granulicella arctica]|uniref:Peptidyl-prolyl cis-trans isomerase n=1 Tax=Granulicella arctica TaxID=940613 RepID=A0A7Y9TI03_9BACT|nr:peptidylprolyl isomerase [Granulicella arctica]NYF81069.1 peptidyl-prolyl cis-trans isomerase A (cyclophilin A) [Granulicella arctica]
MILRSVFFALALGSVGFAQSTPQAPATPPASTTPSTPASTPSSAQDLPDAPSTTEQLKPPAVPTGPTVVIDTTMGRLTCKLFDKEAPVTTANFIGLADGSKEWTDPETMKKVKGKPFYNGVTFHRVIPGFMIQGGDRLGTGMGDAGYFFQDEIDPSLTFDVPGRLAMANAGQGPSGGGTNGSQFFITEVPVPELNGKHTIFGQCDEHSVLLVASIARVDRDSSDKPTTPVMINKVTVVREGQALPPLPAAPAPAAATSTAPATPALIPR